MSPRPVIFISAVTRELRSARQLVSNTLTFLGYEPEWQDIFSTEEGDLRGMLRRRVDACKGVVQLVGQCYGAEPPTSDEQFGRVSYTQYEALYARQQKKKVWYLILNDDFTTDPYEPEPQELHDLQIAYRKRLKSENVIRHSLSSRDALEADVLKLRDELTRLRRGVKQWAVGVVVLLVLSVGLGVWSLQRQVALNAKMDKVLAQGVVQYAPTESKVKQEQPRKLNPAEVQQRTYEVLAKLLGVDGVDAKVLQEKLPRYAEELKNAPNATAYERANAAYVTKDYNEAERLALVAADEAEKASPPKTSDVIKALVLAGDSAEARIEYSRAAQHFQAAAQLTDRVRDPLAWAGVQWKIAFVLDEQGKYVEADTSFRNALSEYQRVRGDNSRDVLALRNNLAISLQRQGKFAEAEAQFREIIELEKKNLGATHADTLTSRSNLAVVLENLGKFAEAEAESREVIKLQEKVFGPESPDTVSSRNNLAIALERQGKYGEAEMLHRESLKILGKLLGAEHPKTLSIRMNLATMLSKQGKYERAEEEYREGIKLLEKVLGPDHDTTIRSRIALAAALSGQGKYADAESQLRNVIKVEEKVFGPEHPITLTSRNNLANALSNEGKYGEAEAQFKDVLNLQEKTLGREHPDALTTRNNLTSLLLSRRKYTEAEVQYREVIQLRQRCSGQNIPTRLAAEVIWRLP